MDGYIFDIRNKYGHPKLEKPQHSLHKYRPINYGTTKQLSQAGDTSPGLDTKGIKRVQVIVGALLYVGRAVNNKLPVALSKIGAQQAAAME